RVKKSGLTAETAGTAEKNIEYSSTISACSAVKRGIQESDVAPPMTLTDLLARARVFDLEQPRFAGMPVHPVHKPGYFYALHRRHRDTYRPGLHGPRSGASGVLTMMEHSGTHIDALCHQACDLKLHGDVAVESVERP